MDPFATDGRGRHHGSKVLLAQSLSLRKSTDRPPPPLPQLVTPIFAFLAVEVDKKGTDKVEVAARVTYDDVNESLCMAEVVHKVRPRGGPAARQAAQHAPAAGWHAGWLC